jgi:hypothetical protein
MRGFLDFWWICIRRAFWGNTAFANDWQWVFGVPAVSGVLGYLAANKGATDLGTGYPIADGVLTALGAFVVTWCVAFAVRVLNAPVVLYHEQKKRADALDGSPPQKPKTSDKTLAILQERYLSRKAPIAREYLDYEVDGLRAANDVSLIFNGLTALARKQSKIMTRHTKRLNRTMISEKRRDAISLMAKDLIQYADDVDEYAAIFRSLTPTLLECTVQFIERSPELPAASYQILANSLDGSIAATLGTLQSLEGNQRTSQSFKGVSAELNQAARHLENVQTGLLYEINNYRNVCGELRSLALMKATDGNTEQNEQAV